MSRIAATSRRRSSTLSSMMQSRNVALATIVMTPIARWNRLTTRNVFDVSTAISRDAIRAKSERRRVHAAQHRVGRPRLRP